MRLRSLLVPPALTMVGVLALGACSQAPEVSNTSTGNATGTSITGSTGGTDTSINLGAGPATGDTTANGNAGGNTGNGGSGGNTGGNSGGASTAPAVTSATGPGTVSCPNATSMVSFTAHFSVAHAKYIEYLAPTSDRPGAGPANGSVMFNYDCSKASQVFKIRAFNEFNGSDAKDPSPYVAFTVTRKLDTSSSSSSTSTSKAPTTTPK